jgi:hypothetical protein
MEALRASFKPEFLNRIDETIIFHNLQPGQIAAIVDIQMQHLAKRLADLATSPWNSARQPGISWLKKATTGFTAPAPSSGPSSSTSKTRSPWRSGRGAAAKRPPIKMIR